MAKWPSNIEDGKAWESVEGEFGAKEQIGKRKIGKKMMRRMGGSLGIKIVEFGNILICQFCWDISFIRKLSPQIRPIKKWKLKE
jgi:hypothetical protein